MKLVITVLTGVFLSASVFAQDRVVYGTLTAFNTYPVQNVKVTAKKAKTAVISDSLGQFSIVCFEDDIIKIKPKVFRTVNRRLGPDTDSLTINLLFIDTRSNRELAVGYGYMNREDITYAVSHLEHENNNFCDYSDIFNVIKGRFAGVTVSNGEVHIRGSISFYGETKALYVVNGVPMNDIDWIHPCEIKSINILKGSSASIYGVRGSNGVVIIETRL